ILLVTGRYHRSVAALLGAFLTILFGLEYGMFDLQGLWSELVSFVDLNTVLLVIGIMILAKAGARSGFFEFVGLSVAKTVGGDFQRISLSFIFLTILFSALLSNITAMIIMGALTVSLAKKFRVDPTETILYEAIASNIGGLMLMISSIPNLIVASQLKIGFVDFVVISVPLVLILSLVSMLFVLRRIKARSSTEQQIEVDPWSAVENRGLFYRATIVFLFVIMLFIFEDFTKIPLGLIAIGGAIVMLVLGGQEPESIFSEVDWGTVFFLTSFYVVVGGLEKSGVLTAFADVIVQFLSFHPGLASNLNIWVCGLSSSVIDNIPMTLTLIPVMEHMSNVTGFSLKTLGWGIVFGANLGGNLTPIGSPSNIIGLGILTKEGKSVTWGEWFHKCVPLVILQLLLASVYVTLLSVIL
ncbi:MAG: SLC13 family permease, partial [Candidatus Heimdallarchaeota archaeon]